MIAHARALDPMWLRAAFVFILIGFGTKMGLAPMHSWKPDTYGEAPSLVGGLMAGALTSCAFLGLARVVSHLLRGGSRRRSCGRCSSASACCRSSSPTAFIVGQGDVKRLLAYSSVEHMGLLVLGLGLGGAGAYGAVLHAINNGSAKGMVFLAVGNVVLATGTSTADRIRGLAAHAARLRDSAGDGPVRRHGSPPFGMFISEFTIISAAVGDRVSVGRGRDRDSAVDHLRRHRRDDPRDGVRHRVRGRVTGSGAARRASGAGSWSRRPRWRAGPGARRVHARAAGRRAGRAPRRRSGGTRHERRSHEPRAAPFARLRNRYASRLDACRTLPIDGASAMASWPPSRTAGASSRSSARRRRTTTLRVIAVLARRRARARSVARSTRRRPSAIRRSRRDCAQAASFEREMAEQCGVIPEGHPSLKPLRRHAPDHRPTAWPAPPLPRDRDDVRIRAASRATRCTRSLSGRCTPASSSPAIFASRRTAKRCCALEIVLGYQHRGVETAARDAATARARCYVAESIAGDTVIAHASAYCGAIEALARSHKSARAQSIRGIALELERLANHVGDLGALAGDVAYQPAAAFFGRLRGECLNLLMTISRQSVRARADSPGRRRVRHRGRRWRSELRVRVTRLERDLWPVAELFFGTASVQSRLEGVGTVTRDACIAHGFVGPVARACEVHRDVRHDHPYGVFRYAQIPVATAWAGDVYARALVRWVEIQRSLEFVSRAARVASRWRDPRAVRTRWPGTRSSWRWKRDGAARSFTSCSPTAAVASGATRWSIRRSTTGRRSRSRCPATRSRIFRSATRASTCLTPAMISESGGGGSHRV